MSKICPVCKQLHEDEEVICGYGCGVRLIPMQEAPNPALNLGDANAISGGVNINQSKNITSRDVHYHTVQERNKTEKELLQERQNQYHDAVALLLKGGVLTVEARAQLDRLKFNLGIDDATAANIEATVKNEQKTQARANNDGLSVIGKMALKSAIAVVEENNSQVQGCIAKLAPVCKTTMNEQVHFYYSMLMAACDPQLCVEAYEKRTIDSYWLSYWASVAYRKLGNEMEAEGILTEMTGLWQERPEINVVINACLGIWLSCSGNLSECQETIIEYLTQTEEVPSEELNDLFHALLHAVGVEEEDNARFAFYNEHFLMVLNEEAELKKAQEAYDNKDYETALSIWNRLAERNNAVAIRKIGVCYCYGLGVPQDYAEAIRWNRKAVDLGNAVAMRNLGLYYENGQGVTQDYTEAVKWYQKAADLGDDVAMYNLGYCYENGLGVTQDYAKAVKWYCKAADLGHAKAMDNLGFCYANGNGVSQDHAEAVKWYRKAADLGDDVAMYNLGYCYANGLGVTQDYAKAVKWYRKAADLGEANAMANLGFCYENGQGVSQDYDEAFKWYGKAADLGNARAMFNIGLCYANGQGVSQDYTEAVKWYRKAADLGVAAAMFNLGLCYANGQGVSQDYDEAFKWYGKAADLGNARAMFNLGWFYDNGYGVTQDYAEAVKWYQKAADLGNDYAKKQLELTSIQKDLNSLSNQLDQLKTSLPVAEFEKAWVTQENEQTIGVHFALNIKNSKGKSVTFKCVTKSLSPGSTFDKSTNVIHVHQENSGELNWDDTRWDDWRYLLYEPDIKYMLDFEDYPFELQTELFAYDSLNNCLGSYWIRYKVVHEGRVFKNNRLWLANN